MDESKVRPPGRATLAALTGMVVGGLLPLQAWSQPAPGTGAPAAAEIAGPSSPAVADGVPVAEEAADNSGSGRTLPPYLSIVQRNPFGLQDPPPPAPETPPEPEPEVNESDLKLSGITTLLGGKHAMFVLQEKGKAEMVYSGLVREGDMDPVIVGLKVVAIDEKAGSVKVVYGGKELALDFKNNGLTLPKTATAAAGRPGQPNQRGQAAGGLPANVPHPPGTVAPDVRRAGNTSFSTGGARPTVPGRNNRAASGSSSPVMSSRGGGMIQQQPVMTPVEQALVMRAQEMAGEQAGIPMPPSPPIPGLDSGLDPGLDPGLDGGVPPLPDFPPLPGQ
ncbi:MAG: hypothetical protein H7A45_03725 [Verrucomicrobiales bacterium]|nr:hypothetical protein [Verrucomicrobiales bacterium]